MSRAARVRAAAGADVLAFAVLAVAAAVTLFLAGRGLIFFYDEWSFVLYRRDHDLDAFLEPHNGHLSVLPVVAYKLLFALVGLEHYGPYRLAVIALHLVCCGLLFVLLRDRVGRVPALVGCALVLFLGTAWQDLLWPFQIGYLSSIAGGLAALLALERDRAGLAAAGLAVSLASSGLGIPFAAGVVAALALGRAERRRWLVVAAPLGAYAVWYLALGESQASGANVARLPRYVLDSFTGALGEATGVGAARGPWVAAVAVALGIGVLLWRRTGVRAVPPAVVVLTFWSLTALSRAHLGEPAASRYIYPGFILLLLVAAGLLDGARIPPAVAGLASVAVVLAIAANLRTLDAGAGGLRETGAYVTAALAAVELQRDVVPADLRPDDVRAPQVTAGLYLEAVDELGSPALPVGDLPAQPPELRSHADAALVGAVRASLVEKAGPGAESGSRPPTVEAGEAGSVERSGSCVAFTPSGAQARLELVVPEDGLLVEVGRRTRLVVRRFGDAYVEAAPLTLGPGTSVVDAVEDASPEPWRVRLDPESPVRACGRD